MKKFTIESVVLVFVLVLMLSTFTSAQITGFGILDWSGFRWLSSLFSGGDELEGEEFGISGDVAACGGDTAITEDTNLIADITVFGCFECIRCFKIGADDITFDCQGHTIDGNNIIIDAFDSDGYNGFTIKNCPNITNFDYGFYLEDGANINLTNITANSNNDNGIKLYGVTYSVLDNITANSNNGKGIIIQAGGDCNLTNITANSNSDNGITLVGNYYTLDNIITNSNIFDGIEVNGDYNKITNMTSTLNTRNGFEINGRYNTLSNILASSNRDNQISSNYNNFTYSEIRSNTYMGLYIYDEYNILCDNNISTSNQFALAILNNNNIICNNDINSTESALYLTGASNNMVYDNNITADEDAVFLVYDDFGEADSYGNVFLNNNITASNSALINDTTLTDNSNTLIYNNSYGQINWTSTNLTILEAGVLEMGDTIDITENNIYADSESLPSLNTTATLWFYDLDVYSPFAYRNGAPCPVSICNAVNQIGNIYEVVVQYFTNYSIVSDEQSTAITWANPNTSKPAYYGLRVNFTVDWTSYRLFDSYVFSTNASGSWVNDSPVEFTADTGTETAKVEKLITNSVGSIIHWEMYATNDVTENVTDVQNYTVQFNTAPEFTGTINNITFQRFKSYGGLDLLDYFSDNTTEEMKFGAKDYTYLNITFDGSIVTIAPLGAYYGTDVVTFTADDEEFLTESNLVYVTVEYTEIPYTYIYSSSDWGGGSGGYSSTKYCQSWWVCEPWSECINGKKTQKCTDVRYCTDVYEFINVSDCQTAVVEEKVDELAERLKEMSEAVQRSFGKVSFRAPWGPLFMIIAVIFVLELIISHISPNDSFDIKKDWWRFWK